MTSQLNFDFSSEHSADQDGLAIWRDERRAQMEELGRKQGLPLGHRVRAEFHTGPALEGLLRLEDDGLFVPDKKIPKLRLSIGKAQFYAHEMASCLRLD